MTAPDPREARLRARLASYGAALETVAGEPPGAKPKRHLIAVDGPVGGRRARPRPPWRGPVGRVAAAVVVLAALAGTTWAATRPTEPSTTTTDAGWADDDVVRPEDRPAALAALAGTWPLPPNGSLDFVLDEPADAATTFSAFRAMVADDASCLWFRHAVEEPDLSPDERDVLAAMPTWPGHVDDAAGRAVVAEVADAALAGDDDRLRAHLAADCGGTAAGLGLPEIGGGWLVAGGPSASEGAPAEPVGSATAVDPTQVRGWDAIVARLGSGVTVGSAVALPDGAHNVSLAVGSLTFSLTIEGLRGPVTLPVTEAAFDRGFELRDGGIEVFAGPVGDDATVAQVVDADGRSITLSLGARPDGVEDALGDLADLAVDLHAAAWSR